MTTTVWKQFSFDSAHSLPNVPPGHKCGRLHGHTYRVTLYVTGQVGPVGWVQDYADIAAAWEPLHEALDHTLLNDVPGLANSTSENIARWIYDRLKTALPLLSAVKVRETCTAGCTYKGPAARRTTGTAPRCDGTCECGDAEPVPHCHNRRCRHCVDTP